MTIGEVKSQLARRCGTPVQHMMVQLRNLSGANVAELSDDYQVLGYYSPNEGWAFDDWITKHVAPISR